MSKLTSRDYRLYDYLKSVGDTWVLQRDIAIALHDDFPYSEEDMGDFHNSGCRHAITNSIRALNDSDVIQKIILSSSKGVKIANESEFNSYIGREINSAVRRLMRAKRKADKGNRDGQTRIVFKSERDTIEAFIRVGE